LVVGLVEGALTHFGRRLASYQPQIYGCPAGLMKATVEVTLELRHLSAGTKGFTRFQFEDVVLES
jgi:hypothetical protein